MRKVEIGLYGANGHQIHHALANHPMGKLAAVAAFDPASLPETLRADMSIQSCATLEDLLDNDRIELVSLCSPRRRDQAKDAIRCMEAGKHVYAEKPCAMTEEDLDAILSAAARTGMNFHEMAGTAFDQPYFAMRKLVQAGTIGAVVQALAQKSYPYHDQRPQDENIDGGMLMQAGVHALRFIEHVACVKVRSIHAVETGMGNPKMGGLHMAASIMMTLENGGVASAAVNYLNQRCFGQWGNDAIRIFGTEGFVESVDGGTRTRLVTREKDCGEISRDDPPADYLDFCLGEILGTGRMPMTLEDELHPARMVIRAKESAARGR